METYAFERGRVVVAEAWTLREVLRSVAELLDSFAGRLPADRAAKVVVKPNLNNDLPALVGNSADLRVLRALVEALKERGYTDITLCDGSNVGVDRRGIDAFRRLRVDRLARWLGVRLVDLNQDDAVPFALHAGASPRIARTVLESDFLVSVPKVKTHAEAGLSCAMKNWVGIARGQDKRHVHYDLARNIFALNEVVLPDLILVDAIVGMEGNGPGDGEPFRFGRLMMSEDAFLNDAVVCRMVDLPIEEVPYLSHAREAGILGEELLAEIRRRVPVVRPIARPPPRSAAARVASHPRLLWLKRVARPITDRPEVTEAAHRWGVIQDIYETQDDEVVGVRREADACGECRRCEDFCPTGLTLEEIGRTDDPAKCIGCLYCWWVCPKDAIRLDGPLHHLERQAARYKKVVESL